MSEWIKKLKGFSFFETLRHTSNYFGAVVLMQALSIISLPVYTYFFSEADYGIVNVYLSYATVLGIALSLNLNGAISRYIYEEKKDWKAFVSSVFLSIHLLVVPLGLILLYFQEPICTFINLPAGLFPYLLCFVYALIVVRFFEQIKIARKESKGYSIFQVLLHYSKFLFSVLIIIGLKEQLFFGKIWGELIAVGLFCFYVFWYLRDKISWKIDTGHLKYAFDYGFPLLLFILSGHLLHSFDQWMINANGEEGNAEAGLYSFAYKIGFLLFGFITAILNASAPDYFKMMNGKDTQGIKFQINRMVKFISWAAIFLLLFASDLGKLLAAKQSFTEALDIVPILILGYVAFGLAQIINRNILFEKRNYYLTVIMIAAAIVNVALNYFLIPVHGYKIAAWTTLLSYVVMVLLSMLVYQMYFNNKTIRWNDIMGYILLIVGMALLIHYLPLLNFNNWGILLTKAIIFGIVSVWLFYAALQKFLKE